MAFFSFCFVLFCCCCFAVGEQVGPFPVHRFVDDPPHLGIQDGVGLSQRWKAVVGSRDRAELCVSLHVKLPMAAGQRQRKPRTAATSTPLSSVDMGESEMGQMARDLIAAGTGLDRYACVHVWCVWCVEGVRAAVLQCLGCTRTCNTIDPAVACVCVYVYFPFVLVAAIVFFTTC